MAARLAEVEAVDRDTRVEDRGAQLVAAPSLINSNKNAIEFACYGAVDAEADLVYVTQTALYRSTDGGRTFEAFAGAPSGGKMSRVIRCSATHAPRQTAMTSTTTVIGRRSDGETRFIERCSA